MNQKQLVKLGLVYDAIAKLMPTEGRDFESEVLFDSEDQPRVKIRGITPIGRTFAEHCQTNLRAAIAEVEKEQYGQRTEPVETGKEGCQSPRGMPDIQKIMREGGGKLGKDLIHDVRRAIDTASSGRLGGDQGSGRPGTDGSPGGDAERPGNTTADTTGTTDGGSDEHPAQHVL